MRLKLNRTNIKALEAQADRYEVTDADMAAFRLRVTPAGVKTFVVVYRNAQNQLKRYTIGTFGDVTPEQARAIAEKKVAEVKLGLDPAAAKKEARKKAEELKHQTLGGFLEHRYGPWVLANRKDGQATLKRLEACFGAFKDRALPDVNAWVIEKWRKERLEAGRAASTVNRDIVALKAALARAVDWELIDRHPLVKVKLAKEDHHGVVRYLTQDEESRLRKALKAREDRIRAARDSHNAWLAARGLEILPSIRGAGFTDHLAPMVLLSVNTGMRRGEVFALRWADVNLVGESLAVRGANAKSGKTRHIPLNAEAMAALTAWKDQQVDPDGLVFPSDDGKPFTNVTKAWLGLLESAKINDFRWHDMRHHFASRLVMAGVDLNTVRELLGHSDLTMTLRYAHLAPEHKAAAVAKLGAA